MANQISTWPAIWAAIAATASAVAAFLMWITHRRDFLESVRPQLVLDDISRKKEGSKGAEIITVGTVRNVGRGPAWHIHMFSENRRSRTVAMGDRRIPVVASNDVERIDQVIIVCWNNVGSESVFVDIRMVYSDNGAMRHDMRCELFVVENPETQIVVHAIAPGIALDCRTTSRRARRVTDHLKKVKIWVLVPAVLILCSVVLAVYLNAQQG